MNLSHSESHHRVIIIDQEYKSLEIFRKLLSKHPRVEVTGGFQSAGSALNAIAQDPPDVVLVDAELPEVTGFEMMDRIRALAADPLIVLTSFTSDYAVKSMHKGSFDYLLKPVDPWEIHEMVNRLGYYCRSKSRGNLWENESE